MSTRSNIIAKTKDGYKWIYCHNDGYPGHIGVVLKDYYGKKEIEWLFEKGDASSLGLPFQERKWEDDYNAEKCVFYRSRGEIGVDSKRVTKEYFEDLKDSCAEYFYFFDGSNWFGVGLNKRMDYEEVGLETIGCKELMNIIFK